MAYRFDPNNSDSGRYRYETKPRRRERHLYEEDGLTLRQDRADSSTTYNNETTTWYSTKLQAHNNGALDSGCE